MDQWNDFHRDCNGITTAEREYKIIDSIAQLMQEYCMSAGEVDTHSHYSTVFLEVTIL